ncbi:hypothetical protein ACWOE5_00480 [Aerococcus sanguinicola]|nr:MULTISPECIES: hypothetical protein [Aerococcus]MDK7049743.1 hypothetical protein [Aerococcus sanguinicola]
MADLSFLADKVLDAGVEGLADVAVASRAEVDVVAHKVFVGSLFKDFSKA